MIETSIHPHARVAPHRGDLILDGQIVGRITLHGHSDSWSYGEFAPAEAFGRFAPIFGAWSLMMHVDGEQARMSREAKDELRAAEVAMDALRAELQWDGRPERIRLLQVNIDGGLVEWKV